MRRSMSSKPEIPRGCTRRRGLERLKVRVLHHSLRGRADEALGAKDFTGISAPYEPPETPEIHIKTHEADLSESVRIIVNYLVEKGFI